MKKLVLTTCILSALALMSGCGADNGSTEGGGDDSPISITTVEGSQLQLDGSYTTACYGSPDGRIDKLDVTNTTWTTASSIYFGDETCSSTPSVTGTIVALISKGSDKQISGWKGQGDVAPQRNDATGSLSENETVTTLNIKVTEIYDNDVVFGGSVKVGDEVSAFYVFDDTAGDESYIMYGDDDGDFASASDPYIFSAGTDGVSPPPAAFKFMPVIAASGNTFDMGGVYWASDCYINGSIGDNMDRTEFSVTGDAVDSVFTKSFVSIKQEMYSTSDGTCDPVTKGAALNPDVVYTGEAELDGSTGNLLGWVDSTGATVSAPARQDATGNLKDNESYTDMTFTVQASSIPDLVSVGTVFPLAYVVDDTGTLPVIYSVVAGEADVDSQQICASCI